MAWVAFTRRFVYVPSRDRRVALVYEAAPDTPRNVPRECADKAVAAGAALKRRTPRRPASRAGAAGALGPQA